MTLRGPNSGETDAQIAPSDAHARNAISVSGRLGRNATTRSPLPTPRACNSARAPATPRPRPAPPPRHSPAEVVERVLALHRPLHDREGIALREHVFGVVEP